MGDMSVSSAQATRSAANYGSGDSASKDSARYEKPLNGVIKGASDEANKAQNTNKSDYANKADKPNDARKSESSGETETKAKADVNKDKSTDDAKKSESSSQTQNKAAAEKKKEKLIEEAINEAAGDMKKLQELLEQLIKEGKITPDDAAKALSQAAGGGEASSDGNDSSSGGSSPAQGVGGGGSSPAQGGGGGTAPTSNNTAPQATSNAAPQATSNAASPSGPTDGGTTSDKVGNTQLTIKGGTAEQRADTVAKFKDMYERSPDFKKIVDSKAGQGLDVQLGAVPNPKQGKVLLGEAGVNGNSMTLDPNKHSGGSSGNDYAATIAHEALHLKGENHKTDAEEAVMDKHGYAMAAGTA